MAEDSDSNSSLEPELKIDILLLDSICTLKRMKDFKTKHNNQTKQDDDPLHYYKALNVHVLCNQLEILKKMKETGSGSS